MASELYDSAEIDPTSMPDSELDPTSAQPFDWLTNGLGKVLDSYVQLEAMRQASATGQYEPGGYYRVPGTATVAPIGGTTAARNVSGSTIMLGIAALALVFLLVRK